MSPSRVSTAVVSICRPTPIAPVPPVPARPPIAGTVLAGAAAAALFLGGFGLWAATAPLDSAAVAEGSVVVEGRRKTVQHLEGGIVGEILVAEGSRVRPGDPLVRLDATQARSVLEGLRSRRDELSAREARLRAELDRAGAIAFPAELLDRPDEPRVAALLAGQRELFAARRDSLGGQINILEQRKAQLDAEVAALRAQIAGGDRQLGHLGQEAEDVRGLVAKGLERKPRLLALEREIARLEASRGEQEALIARALQRRGEADLQIIDLRNRRNEEAAGELREVQAELAELSERLRAAADVLARSTVVAPTAGVVVDLRVHTEGGVVGPGEPILDIVPADEPLLIEAKVRPLDIDSVRVGLPAEVRLTAFKRRTTPTLSGDVVHVSADSLADPHTGAASYVAHVAIDRGELEAAGGLELHPGMPAEVMIVTGRRTALDYLLAPIEESFARAFREE